MDLSEYGPFANVVALACALVATFSMMLLKMLGAARRWTWLAGDSPPFLVTAGARMLAVAVMAVTYVTISESNYLWFGLAALVCGTLGLVSVIRFDRLRKQHVLGIPVVGDKGQQLTDRTGRPRFDRVVIGLERNMNQQARADFEAARRKSGGLSLPQFMGGYGATRVNDPEALWDRSQLAQISNQLTVSLMSVFLFAVTTLFLAAFVIEAAGRHR